VPIQRSFWLGNRRMGVGLGVQGLQKRRDLFGGAGGELEPARKLANRFS
jgi:hypothetical protein